MGKSRKKDSIIFIILFIITIFIVFYAMYLFYASFEDGEEVVLNYNEKYSLDYKVYLKDNDFYDSDYVGEDYNVLASSIDTISVDFQYLLNLSNYVQGESYYTINSRIVAYQKSMEDEKKIWDDQKLIKDKAITLYDVDTTNISASDTFTIDYQKYKDRMNDYKNNYAVNLVGNLVIEIEIKTDLVYNAFNSPIDLSTRVISLTIPLTEQVVEISKNIPSNDSNQVIEKANSKINYIKLVLSLIAFLGGAILCVFLGFVLVQLFGYDSKYVRKVRKILRTYNPIIVTVKKINFKDGKKQMVVDSFEELLDAQSELRLPILHCEVKANKENMFAIKYNEDLLTYSLKSDLYEEDKKKKRK